jgi:hypothetical protein
MSNEAILAKVRNLPIMQSSKPPSFTDVADSAVILCRELPEDADSKICVYDAFVNVIESKVASVKQTAERKEWMKLFEIIKNDGKNLINMASNIEFDTRAFAAASAEKRTVQAVKCCCSVLSILFSAISKKQSPTLPPTPPPSPSSESIPEITSIENDKGETLIVHDMGINVAIVKETIVSKTEVIYETSHINVDTK